MLQQDDLFPVPPLSVEVPQGLNEPRLWVRRLKIWEAPGGEVIRDIELRPGLNIVWSPDGADDPNSDVRAIGHGSGKTLFCRLLRYCLGEVRFADEVQRDAISTTLLNGVVGAEVILDGACWAVVRPLGAQRKHFAIKDGDLNAVATMEDAATGIEPLIEAIDAAVLGEGTAQLARLPSGQHAWPIALAWASRDQECRFDDVLDWRSPASGSDAPQPASGDAKGPRLLAMRAFLMAITEDEQAARRREQEISGQLEEAKRQRSFLEWDQTRRVDRLVSDLGLSDTSLPEMPLRLDSLKSAARQRLAAAAKLPAGNPSELSEARNSLKAARATLREAELKVAGLEVKLPLEEKILSQLNSEIPGLSAAAQTAASPICPICEVPLDAALAEGCKLSHRLPDAAQCRARWNAKRQEVEAQAQVVSGVRTEIESTKPEIALAVQNVQQAEERVRRLEEAADARNTTWRTATRSVEDAQRCAELFDELAAAKTTISSADSELQRVREQVRGFEDKQAQTIGAISQKFSAIVRRLLGGDVKGTIRLTGKGLEISVEAGGDRRTAAIESLKVLAFDLSCLCLSIEGRTRIPAFLIHDSPREADLGQTIYDEYFQLLKQLEEELAGAVFQYVVTTTTKPPQEVNCDPWRRVVLRGAPGSARLLRRDL
ncbi:MAG: chromosome segregation protein SMC [Rhizobiales bacterium]|nr:chromosome segregation protein SMC [Hyphomicrobiales bacterium]MBO6699333.1 chromosome segregation protein SMC [Hyphomicrobiales bacterium]MBO6736871.1 chromosome segregation protein SMC [Hyphomicrobiales bacterium]MBO6912055.1 chromosome segregation protein SMC [Hyphomicrobiales bacterium]MBO6954577.1 chromosome segregation protein SMC [Hyphomicrobiales bacterium]